MSRTEQLLEQARDSRRAHANTLQRGLGQKLHSFNEPQRARIYAALTELKARHITLLDEGVQCGLLREDDYRRLIGTYTDEIDISDLLSALA